MVIADDEDFTYGLLNSRVHTTWALKMGTFMGVGNDLRYTPTTCFETYPFPHATPDARAAVAKAGAYLHTIREHLKTSLSKTLTELYNDLQECRANPKPTHAVYSLYDAHERLDAAVIAAYGWNAPLGDDEILAKLLALNLERATKGNFTNS